MVTEQTPLRPNAEKVIANLIDGEPIMINLSSGVYYSMSGVGGFVWERIAASNSIEQIAAALAERYEVSLDRALADVTGLVAQLLAEEVIVASENGATEPIAAGANGAERLSYEAPQLDVYRDIGHLCALDPPMPGLENLRWNEPGDDSST